MIIIIIIIIILHIQYFLIRFPPNTVYPAFLHNKKIIKKIINLNFLVPALSLKVES